MMCPFGWTCLAAAAFGLLLAASVSHAAGDYASGALLVGKERFALKHVFAVSEADPLAEGDKERTAVFLSDQPVPDDRREASDAWYAWANEQARAGALHGVVLLIDAATKTWSRGHLLSRRGIISYSETVSSPALSDLRFEPAPSPAEQIAGKVWMKNSMSGVEAGEERWRVEAEFRASVVPRPAVSAVLTGAAAQSSPQYKAVRAFLEACRKKDFNAIRESVDARSQETLAQTISAEGRGATLNMFAQMASGSLALKLNKVTVRGDSAEVELIESTPCSEDRMTYRVVLRNGAWKLSQ